jgi:hypothetical protein
MTRDDIIGIYSQVSDELCGGTEWCWQGVGEPLQRFAALVAASEREACAKLCEEEIEKIKPVYSVTTENALKSIRARGQ